ncbi:serine/threonine protein kinase [Scytonema hofmannii FACHB-248]|uniref:Serine/threonine protein kinase n=1 Tax=Scytonema hofmannii FACHB-248 TaxID=1842502 RepID=A0ABR8GSI6_9CYAN|nr:MULTISPECIES: serine/threonine-protein kinase [Nostocales]MBD2606172.1 serine/threonine protein kinase [Scytonema hofmannii FACHB-248]
MNKSAFACHNKTELLANRYQIKQLIGKGGMGEVFLASDILLGGIPVAIKFLSQTVTNPRMQEDFAREARTCAILSQKSLHIVRAHDYGVSEQGKPFYVMEYLCGKSLKDLIPIPLAMFITLGRQICLGLQCAHEGIKIDEEIYQLVHKDIKPANILVIPDPILGQLAKILDFGIAKFLKSSATTSTTRGFNGTLPYCSPEQLEGEKLDNRSDIYSLGVTMYEMLTGKKPWQPETDLFGAWYKAHHFETPRAIADINPNLKLPKELDDLIMACLAKAPSERPQNITQVLNILEKLDQSTYLVSLPATLIKAEYTASITSLSASGYNARDLLSGSTLWRHGTGNRQVLNPNALAPLSPISPAFPLGSGLPLIVEKACWKLFWPQDKPIQEIVFPQLINVEQGFAALLLMMSKKEINNRAFCTRYNQFIFVTSPHPMLLWLTVLYNKGLEPKWLPCYLDMQNPQNQKLVSSLAENERYPLIFFTSEAPHSCANVISSGIDPTQRQMLKTWLEHSQSLPPSSLSQLSKNLLKQEYKKMQFHILRHLQCHR